MWAILSWIVIIAVLGGLIVAGAWYYKTQMSDSDSAGSGSGLFGSRPEKRLGIVEQSNVDGRRKLVLIKRDNIEHLIMTGGPVDVVIETNIRDRNSSSATTRLTDTASEPAVYSRDPKKFGQAV